ncbi:hypothetical protein BH24ACT14_BH24ACT14_11590 [soil metagenome]|jgi:cell wall-associated NlpC family hydrolase
MPDACRRARAPSPRLSLREALWGASPVALERIQPGDFLEAREVGIR